MARIKIETEGGDELVSLSYTSRIDAGGEELIILDEDGIGILQGGLPGQKGPPGDPGQPGEPGVDGQPGDDYQSMLGVPGGICPLGPDAKVPSANLPAAPSGGAAPGSTAVYQTARMMLAPTTAVAISGVVPWNHASNRNDTSFTYANGVFTAPAVIPDNMMVRASFTVVFNSAVSGCSGSFLRNGAGFAGNGVRTTVAASVEKEFNGVMTAWFKPAPNETISCTVNSGGTPVIRGDSSWMELEVRYNV